MQGNQVQVDSGWLNFGGNMGAFSKAVGGCSGFLFCLMLISCGGGSKPAAEADFTLTATPASTTLVPGGAPQPISVSASAANGFVGTVTVAIVGAPAGVTVQPATLTLTPGTAQSVNVTAAANAAAGNATLTFTGTSGALESLRHRCDIDFGAATARFCAVRFAHVADGRGWCSRFSGECHGNVDQCVCRDGGGSDLGAACRCDGATGDVYADSGSRAAGSDHCRRERHNG